MKTISQYVLTLLGLFVVTCLQADQPLDVCAYPSDTPPDKLINFAGAHTKASVISTYSDSTNISVSLFDSSSLVNTNDVNDARYNGNGPAAELANSFWYECGHYGGDCYNGRSGCGFAAELEAYLSGILVPGNGNSYAAILENHTATKFNVTMVATNDTMTSTTSISRELLDPYIISRDDEDDDLPPTNYCVWEGMPRWQITEPHLNLWVKDSPVFYTTSLGQKISFNVAYKQRDNRPCDTSVPPTGWSHNWFSYVHFVVPTYLSDTNSATPGLPMPGSTGPVHITPGWVFTNNFSQWQALLYTRDNGQNYFEKGANYDSKFGLKLITVGSDSSSGFKLIHADGSVDEYSIVTRPTFSFGIAKSRGRQQDFISQSPRRFSTCGTTYYADGTNNYVQDTIPTEPPYGQIVGYVSCDAILTSCTDSYGNSISLNYTTNSDKYYLATLVDYDGNTTTFGYDGAGMLSGVSMPYGRSASFASTNGQFTRITDVAGMTSTFCYQTFLSTDLFKPITNIYLSSMTTPYGTTAFDHYEVDPILVLSNTPSFQRLTGPGGTVSVEMNLPLRVYAGRCGGTNRVNKACTVTLPDGSHELYMYRYDSRNLVPSTYAPDEIPFDGSSGGVDDGVDLYGQDPTGIDHLLSTRNSYHWNRQQYEFLSTTDILSLTNSDFKICTLKHWLQRDSTETVYPYGPEQNVSSQLSMMRIASPDGSIEGAKTWFDHAQGSPPWKKGSDDWVKAATVLPTGGVKEQTTTYNAGLLSSIDDSYITPDGYVGTRRLTYVYNDPAPIYNSSSEYYNRLSEIDTPTYFLRFSYSGDGSEMNLTDSENRTTSYFYNSRHQITGIKHPSGLTTTNIYGGDGFLAASIDLESSATTTFSFANGQPSSITTPLGLQLNYSWDKLSRLTMAAFPDGTTISNVYTRLDLTDRKDRLNHWTHAAYDLMQQPYSSTDANGNITLYSHCFCGALESITDPLGSSTTFTRDYNGNVTQASSSDGFNIVYKLNILGQATNITTSASLNLNYTYNNQGLVTNVSNSAGTLFAAGYDAGDRPVRITDAQGITITNEFDTLGRITRRLGACGQSEQSDYIPQGIRHHYDALGNVTFYYYDAAGRLSSVADSEYSPVHTNGFTYNPVGQIATLTDGNGHVTSWNYNIYGQNTAKIDADGIEVSTNGYDANGRLTAHWTPAKQLTHYTYDANGNPLTTAYSDSTGVTATYDELNRIKSMDDTVGSSTFGYQNFGAFEGALLGENGPWASDTLTHSYANRLPQSLTLTQPNGPWGKNYTYDSLLRLTTVASPAGSFTYSYNNAGRQIYNLSLPGGNSIASSYDAAGQLSTTALMNSGNTVRDSFGYIYDLNGNRTNVLRANNSHVAYGYDSIGQLTSAMGVEPDGVTVRGNENFGYGYDPAGNLAMRTNNTLIQAFTTAGANELMNITRNNLLTVAGSLTNTPASLTINGQNATIYNDLTFAVTDGVELNNGLNQFTAVVSSGLTMTNVFLKMLPASVNLRSDLNGNLVWDGLKAYDYDCANELTRITVTNAWKTEFAYDGFGRRRVRKEFSWSGGSWTQTNEVHYVYDGMLVIQERNSNNVPQVTYTRGLDLSGTMDGAGGIGGLLARSDADGSAYYHADGNGNVTAMVDSSGNVVAKYLYDSFGNLIDKRGILADVNTYRFSSKEIDVRSGLYYYGYRNYDPNFQRWLNCDPDQEAGGFNLYQYIENNPVNLADAYGLKLIVDGPRSFRRIVMSDLFRIRDANPALAGMLNELIDSKNTYHIAPYYDDPTFNLTGNNYDPNFRTVFFNPCNKASGWGNLLHDPADSLAHELRHALSQDRGNQPYGRIKSISPGWNGTPDYDEVPAVYYENLMRKANHEEIRKWYTKYGLYW